MQGLARLKAEQGIADNEFYHYDTPLTVKHEIDVCERLGFPRSRFYVAGMQLAL